MTFKAKTIILVQSFLILFLISCVLVAGGDLKQTRKMILDQSNFCIKYTSDIIAKSQITLVREQDAHSRTLDNANARIEDLVNRYNTFINKYNKSTNGINYDVLNQYSYMIAKTSP